MRDRVSLRTAVVRLRATSDHMFFDRLPALMLFHHIAWMRQVRILADLGIYDQWLVPECMQVFNPGQWNLVLVLLEPGTFREVAAFAKICKELAPETRVVGVGDGLGFERATGGACCDLIVSGYAYSYLEEIAQGGRPVGLVRGDRWSVDMPLPREAFTYRHMALAGSWGILTKPTWLNPQQGFEFAFRGVRTMREDIDRMIESDNVRYCHFVDPAFIGHPDYELVLGASSWQKPWGITLDGRKRRGAITRIQRGWQQGLRIVKMDFASLDPVVLSACSLTHRWPDLNNFLKKTSPVRTEGLKMVVELMYGLPNQTAQSVQDDYMACVKHRLIPIFRRAHVDVKSYLWQMKGKYGIVLDENGYVTSTNHMTTTEIEELAVTLAGRNRKSVDTISAPC